MTIASRRVAITAAGAVLVGTAARDRMASGAEVAPPKLWTLAGELRVHPKFLYRYYLLFGDGQKCALYGADHARDPKQLAALKLPARVQVRGTLGTDYHSGGTQENLSPFPAGWTLYMDVHEVEELK